MTRYFKEQNRDIDKGSPEKSSEKKDSSLKSKQDINLLSEVKNVRLKNVSKRIIGQIKINSTSTQLKELVLKLLIF